MIRRPPSFTLFPYPPLFRSAVDRMRAAYGGVDVLICAAGVQGPIGPFLSAKPRAWNETIETNLIGVANACRAVLPPMIEKRDRKSKRLNSSHSQISYAVFCL